MRARRRAPARAASAPRRAARPDAGAAVPRVDDRDAPSAQCDRPALSVAACRCADGRARRRPTRNPAESAPGASRSRHTASPSGGCRRSRPRRQRASVGSRRDALRTRLGRTARAGSRPRSSGAWLTAAAGDERTGLADGPSPGRERRAPRPSCERLAERVSRDGATCARSMHERRTSCSSRRSSRRSAPTSASTWSRRRCSRGTRRRPTSPTPTPTSVEDAHPLDRLLPVEDEEPHRDGAGGRGALRRRGPDRARRPRDAARRRPQDRQRRALGVVRRCPGCRSTRTSPGSPARLKLTNENDPVKIELDLGGLVAPGGVGRALAAAHRARPPGVRRAPPAVRRVRPRRHLPVRGQGRRDRSSPTRPRSSELVGRAASGRSSRARRERGARSAAKSSVATAESGVSP